jgi:integrase
VRGPKYVVKKGKTPVLNADEARELIDSIEITKTVTLAGVRMERPDITGLRDSALIAVMVYTFARVNAVLQMQVRDYFVQGRRGWVRLHEKGGKEDEVPCHHNLEPYLDEYISDAGIAGRRRWASVPYGGRQTGALTRNTMWQQDAYRMIQRRAADAGIKTRLGNHTFRATGITAYLDNGGSLENAQAMASHESPRTTKLYVRTDDQITLDEVEKIGI